VLLADLQRHREVVGKLSGEEEFGLLLDGSTWEEGQGEGEVFYVFLVATKFEK
jgi:hypothetical protein